MFPSFSPRPPTAFLSYSAEDKQMARHLATELRAGGVDVWLDQWEIRAGDSIVQKVFEEGLEGCDVFLVLVSDSSSRSRWVYEELSAAFLARLQGETRIIPLRIDTAEVPRAIRHLRWIDLGSDLPAGIFELLQDVHGRSQRPPLGNPPEGMPPPPPRALPHRALAILMAMLLGGVALTLATLPRFKEPGKPGMSSTAHRVGTWLVRASKTNQCLEDRYRGEALSEALPDLTPEQISFAVAELVDLNLVGRRTLVRPPPYRFEFLWARPSLFHELGKSVVLGYSPLADLKLVSQELVKLSKARPAELETATGLSKTRLNRAVQWLKESGLAKVHTALPRPPYGFVLARATHRTQAFLSRKAPGPPPLQALPQPSLNFHDEERRERSSDRDSRFSHTGR